MSIDILKEQIKNGKLRNLYVFYGPEEYLKKYYTESIENILLKDDFKTLNRIILEGKIETKRIVEACETMPAFSANKVVIIKNSGLLKSKKKSNEEEGKGKSQGEDLISYIQGLPNYTCLIFYESEIDKRMKIVDIAKKNGLLVEFPYQKPAELVKWVAKAFKSLKKEIDPAAASMLVDNSEMGMNEILNEVNKLALYLGEKTKVSIKDVEEICTKSIKGRIFDLTDAIAEKNGIKAFAFLNDMIILKEPLPKILFMITRQFRHVLQMKLLNQSGMNVNEAASKLGIAPYAAGKALKQAVSFSVNTLKEAIEESLELDIAIKTGKLNDRIAVELLITKFSK